MRLAVLVVAVLSGVPACQGERPAAEAAPAGKPAAPAGPRQIAIQVSEKGYSTTRLEARPGEKLTLVFTRTDETECGRYVKVPGVAGQTELPVGKPVALPLTMPAKGEVAFTCGMDMMRGTIVVK